MSVKQILKGATEWLLTKPTRERTFAMFLDIVRHQEALYAMSLTEDEAREWYANRIPKWNLPS
jgi:hypothetical protein